MKKSVNLLLKQFSEPPWVRKLKIVLPVSAAAGLILFVITFLISIYYVNNNTAMFNVVRKEVDVLEQKIAAQKNTEGIYTLTAARLNVLNQILTNRKEFSKLISEIDSLKQDGIDIVSASVDENNNVVLSLNISSSESLDSLVNLLIEKEEKGIFSKTEAFGIIREKKGNYILSVSLNAAKL